MSTQVKRKPLLSTNNAKTIKGEKLGYITYILYMSSYKANSKRINLCPNASKGCAESCLVGSGFGGMYTNVMKGRMEKSEYFLSDREAFLYQLKSEIEKALIKHKDNAIVTFRLNGTTDIAWEKFKVFDGKNIFEIFPSVQFYDYTKNWLRFDRELPKNYYLTFSRSETNHSKCIELLNRGINVAMVFDKIPSSFEGFEVINADTDDLRFLDKRGTICGLKYKKMTGRGADNTLAIKSGFVIQTQTIEERLTKLYKKVSKKKINELV